MNEQLIAAWKYIILVTLRWRKELRRCVSFLTAVWTVREIYLKQRLSAHAHHRLRPPQAILFLRCLRKTVPTPTVSSTVCRIFRRTSVFPWDPAASTTPLSYRARPSSALVWAYDIHTEVSRGDDWREHRGKAIPDGKNLKQEDPKWPNIRPSGVDMVLNRLWSHPFNGNSSATGFHILPVTVNVTPL